MYDLYVVWQVVVLS